MRALLPLLVLCVGCASAPTAPVMVPFEVERDVGLLTLPLPGPIVERIANDLDNRDVRAEIGQWLRQLFATGGPTLGFSRAPNEGAWAVSEPVVMGKARVDIRFAEDEVVPVLGQPAEVQTEPIEGGFRWDVVYLVQVGELHRYLTRLEATATCAAQSADPTIRFEGRWNGPFVVEDSEDRP